MNAKDEVDKLIKVIIDRNNLNPVLNIKYSTGSKPGDGYLSSTVAVDIKNERRTLNLFLKCALSVKSSEISIDGLFANEVYFYDTIYPLYSKILEECGIEDGFRNVPQCYGTTENIIALENLKTKGYVLFNSARTDMNENHLVSVLKTYANLHALSFVFKQKYPDKFNEINGTVYTFANIEGSSFEKTLRNLVKEYMNKLDAVKDKLILEKLQYLADNLFDILTSPSKPSESKIILHGDCWSNNIMFLYEGENGQNPIHVVLLDWQLLRVASPVFDLCYFFYTVANKEALDKLDHYLQLYHEELSKEIHQLGSDSEILYPYSLFRTEWKQFCRYGLALAFLFVKMMLSATDETQSFEEIGEINIQKVLGDNQGFQHEDKYTRRICDLVKHMVDNDFI